MKPPAIFLAFALSAAPSFAFANATLLGADTAHSALSGAHYTCDLVEMKFDMIFNVVQTKAKVFPYEFRAGKRISKDAYIVTDAGEIHLQSAEEVRYLTLDQDTLSIAKTPDGRAARCKAM